jgi:hypothetical protein
MQIDWEGTLIGRRVDWEGEAPVEPKHCGSAAASPPRPPNDLAVNHLAVVSVLKESDYAIDGNCFRRRGFR